MNNQANFDNMTIAVNTGEVKNYLSKIKSDVIEAAKDLLDSEEEALFNAFRENWIGKSEENFEHNMQEAKEEIKKALNEHYRALEEKIEGIHNAWIEQDEQMVGRQGGWF